MHPHQSVLQKRRCAQGRGPQEQHAVPLCGLSCSAPKHLAGSDLGHPVCFSLVAAHISCRYMQGWLDWEGLSVSGCGGVSRPAGEGSCWLAGWLVDAGQASCLAPRPTASELVDGCKSAGATR
jgi:hypothetical protein